MTARRRTRLRTIAARQVWDGRKPHGGSGFIPGIRHFQAGVRAYRAAAARGDAEAAARLGEIDDALDALDRSLVRWRRGFAAFVSERVPGGAAAGDGGRWRRSGRLLRIRSPETRRLAALIERYDAVCANTVAATAACRRSGIANPHGASIVDRRRRLRAVIAMGHGGVKLRESDRGRPAALVASPVPARPKGASATTGGATRRIAKGGRGAAQRAGTACNQLTGKLSVLLWRRSPRGARVRALACRKSRYGCRWQHEHAASAV